MLEFPNIEKKPMTLMRTGGSELTAEEFEELVVLKKAINDNPASVHYEKMERFAELMVRSLDGKGDRPVS